MCAFLTLPPQRMGLYLLMTVMFSFAFSNFLNIDPITMAYSLKSPAQEHLTTLGMYDRQSAVE